MLDKLRQFFSAEAGQGRREGITALGRRLDEGLDYYLGPTGIPNRLRFLNQAFNPVVHAEEAGSAARRAASPDLPAGERVASGIESLGYAAGAAVPGYAALRGLMTPAEALIASVGMSSPAATRTTRAELTEELVDYNRRARTPTNMLDRNVVPPTAANLFLRPDRNYRYIGAEGYEDFVNSGVIRARQGTKQEYGDAYFMQGQPSGRYAGGGGDRYIVESPHSGNWTADPAAAYVRPPRALTREDPIRIFELGPDGTYRVIFDSIGDRAFLQ